MKTREVFLFRSTFPYSQYQDNRYGTGVCLARGAILIFRPPENLHETNEPSILMSFKS